jgi:hypothetical protein
MNFLQNEDSINFPLLSSTAREITEKSDFSGYQRFRLPADWVRTGNTLWRIAITLDQGSLVLPTLRQSHW